MLKAAFLSTLLLGPVLVGGAECDFGLGGPLLTRFARFPIDYLYRRPVLVTAGSSPAPADYTVALTFDHQALVQEGKALANGDDLRVAWLNGTEITQIDRLLGRGSLWNAPNTTVVFRLQAALPALGTQTYYLYYGGAHPGPPPTDATRVYWYATDFADVNGAADWTKRDVVQDTEWFINGSLRQDLNGENLTGLPYVDGRYLLTARPPARSIEASYTVLTQDSGLWGSGLCSDDAASPGFYFGQTQDQWFDADNVGSPRIGYWSSTTDTAWDPTVSLVNVFTQVTVRWVAGTLSVWIDAAPIASWNTAPQADGYFCFIVNGDNLVDFDDLALRFLVDPPPTATLGDEERLR